LVMSRDEAHLFDGDCAISRAGVRRPTDTEALIEGLATVRRHVPAERLLKK